MSPRFDISFIASLIADPARTAMLTALVGGEELPAGELAFAANVSAQTASSHLSKLVNGGLMICRTEGRHRYYRLAGTHVAHALEYLAAISPVKSSDLRHANPKQQSLRFARCCYDHLAGQVGVIVTEALQKQGVIIPDGRKQFAVTASGVQWFSGMGLDVAALKPTRNGIARQCLDWTEKRHHLAGPLGVQLLSLMCAKGWFRQSNVARALRVTPRGWGAMKDQLGIDQSSFLSR